MHLIKIAQMAVGTISEADIQVVMPLVGITVVMLGLIGLATVLKMFVFLDNESPKVAKSAPTPVAEKKDELESAPVVSSAEDDELAAIAFALYLYTSEENVQMPLTHDSKYNNAGWQLSQRQSQVQTYDRWSALRRNR